MNIIELAREAGLSVQPPQWGYSESHHFAGFEDKFERFAQLVRAAALEEAEKIAEEELANSNALAAYNTVQRIRQLKDDK